MVLRDEEDRMKIGFTGLGQMGARMAANLVKAGPLIAEGEVAPAAFPVPLGYKDIRLTLAAAEDLRVSMPLGSLLHDRFLHLIVQGGGHLDWAAIGGLAAQDAGEAAQ
jgi:3-hydroxyisobutyrate dehydrogenase-like beta-hydroxyacid dehydrogenase